MGDDPVTGEESPKEERTLGAIFDRLCPWYLSIGMPYDLFWNGDVCAARAYRHAEKHRVNKKNEEMWLQGLYIYNALCCVSPVLHAFAKSGTKPQPYLSEPFPLTKQREDTKDDRKPHPGDAKAKAMMEVFMVSFNKRFEEGGKENGRRND